MRDRRDTSTAGRFALRNVGAASMTTLTGSSAQPSAESAVLPALAWALARDLRISLRSKAELGIQLLFYVIVVTLFPLATTPERSLLAAIGPGVLGVAALTLGLRGGGSLLALLVLPLYVPVLIFGAGSVDAVQAGMSAGPHLSLLGAGLLIAIVAAPFAAAAAVRVALD